MSRNKLELLLSLGVDNDTSKANIQTYINNLKKELPSLKLTLDIDGTQQTSKDFGQLDKQVQDLQNQIKQLKQELKGVDVGISADGINKFKKEIGSSIKSVDDLKKAVANFNGDMTLNFKKTTLADGTKEDILQSVNASMRGLNGTVQNITFKPILDSNGLINGLEEVSSKIKNVDFKDFDNKARKTTELINDLGRQGYLSADQLNEFKVKVDTLKTNKSVDELMKLENQLNSLNKVNSHDDRMNNSMVNMERQARGLIETLSKLKNAGNVDTGQISNLAKEIERIGTTNITSVSQLDKLNVEFKNIETTVNTLVKKSSELTKIDTAMASISPTVDRLNEKLTTTINKLGSNVNTEALEKIKNEIQAISNTEIKTTEQIAKLNSHISQTEKSITQLTVSANSMNTFNDTFRKVENSLINMERGGYSSKEAIDAFKATLQNIPTGDLHKLKNLLNDIDKEMSEVAHNNAISKSLTQSYNDLDKLQAQLEKTKNLYKRSFDRQEAEKLKEAIDQIKSSLNSLGENDTPITRSQLENINRAISTTNAQVRQFNANATVAVRNATGLRDALEQAFTKFPIWMLASTTFYSTFRGVKDLTEKVIELDTAMTNLIRVADGEQFEFDKVVERSIENVTALSGKLTDYMDLVAEFARTGKSIDESFDLADTTQMLVNISDLDAKDSMDALTSAMIAFGIEAENSARIADKINEIDNSFPVTTKVLSDGMLKASATAATFGVELDSLLGNITAISSATRESGAIVGNALKSIYARITTNSSAINALDAIGISMEKVDGTAKNSEELIKEVAGRWDSLSDAQRRNTAVGVAGIYQLSRLKKSLPYFESVGKNCTISGKVLKKIIPRKDLS